MADSVAGATLEVHVWRGKDEGRFEVHEVPATANQTILDVVTWLQAPSYSRISVSIRLPSGRVRHLLDDRQRAAALDLPYPRQEGRGER